MAGPRRKSASFEDRRRNAEARIARLNREDMAEGEPTLEGPGSEERLKRLKTKFRSTGVGARPMRIGLPAPGRSRGRLGLILWLTVWATCIGLAAAFLLAR
jgi:hypothetical protein